MAGLIEKLLNRGRDPEAEEKIRKEAAAAKADYEADIGKPVPEEEGAEELYPGEELGVLDIASTPEGAKYAEATGFKQAAVPFGASTVKDVAKKASSFIARLRSAGIPESQIKQIANDVRMGRTYTFPKKGGKLGGSIGSTSTDNEVINELKEYSRAATDSDVAKKALEVDLGMANATTGSKVPKEPKIAGEALEYFKRTGVDPTRRNALETLEEVRKKAAIKK
jgi:hypothetical protein